MQNERKRILEMVENGKISAQEAITLLEALEKKNGATQIESDEEQQDSTTNEQADNYNKKQKEDFNKIFQEELKDFRKDLSQLGSLFMDMLNTTVKKVKDFDVKTPFGDKYEFTYTPEIAQQPVEKVNVDLPNGTVTIEPADGDDLQVTFEVKSPYINESEQETRANVLDKLIVHNDNGKLSIISDMKLTQINTTILLPVKQLQGITARLMNGGVSLRDIATQKLSIKTLNGAVKGVHVDFERAKIETSNGAIELREVTGKELEAETMNGRVYIDGALDDIEAKSINGHVIVTTTTEHSSKIEAQTVAGVVELYVPRNLSLTGRASTNFGKLDIGIPDASMVEQQEQFLAKSIRFDKEVADANKLFIEGESKTGSVIVRYAGVSTEQ